MHKEISFFTAYEIPAAERGEKSYMKNCSKIRFYGGWNCVVWAKIEEMCRFDKLNLLIL